MGNKTLTYGNADMLVLKLLENTDMYGYQISEELEKRSCNVFRLSAGSLYPLLHNLENKGLVDSYESDIKGKTSGKTRKYYHITEKGRLFLLEKSNEWKTYSEAVNLIIL